MILILLNIVAPVFLVIAAGYVAVKKDFFSQDALDGLNRFVVLFAIPCLLFRATAHLDLSRAYDWRVLLGFFLGATLSFVIAGVLMRAVFGRTPGEAVAIGFGALFSNLVLLGLPVSERAFGAPSLATNYAVISVHAPYCYLIGITAMELARSDGRSALATAREVLKAMFRNSLMIGLGLGFAVNLSGLPLPGVVDNAAELMSRAALPAALFGLGGVLTRYRLSARALEAASIAALSLVLHPVIVYAVGEWLAIEHGVFRSAVLMAAMPPGVNAYLFSAMYARGQDTAAATVLLATMASVFSLSAWLWLLG